MMSSHRIDLVQAVRDLCRELDRVVEVARRSGVPADMLAAIKHAKADLERGVGTMK
jgi:hypothetical protein